MRTIRLSVAVVWNRYTHGLTVKSRATATPSSPPSPSVPETSGTVPTTVFVPSGATRTTSWVSRSVISAEPSGRNARPHGTAVSVPNAVTRPTGSCPGRVVADTGPPGGDACLAASAAVTVNVYAVSGASPAIVAAVPVAVPTTVVPLSTVYPVTPTSSVDGSQASATLLAVTAVTRTLPGAVGGPASTTGGPVGPVTVVLACDTLPAPSRALT